MDPYVKGVNTDKRSKKKLRFTSAKERSKRASADVYRSYKRQYGVTSAATREEFVHNPSLEERARKRSKSSRDEVESSSSLVANTTTSTEPVGSDDDEIDLRDSTTFASELDIALDRNASEIFAKFHRKVWGLVRSLPEILHHSEKIVDLLLSHLLSPASHPEEASNPLEKSEEGFVVNHATTDILHLLSVLARDLRHEIHPFLHSKIIPRFVNDLLNPPPPSTESEKQQIPLSVTVVEAAFRTLSYIFRYDSELIVQDMELMRNYYGKTLAHRRELVRRLAAEAFAPLVRKIKSDKSRNRHLKRVLRALFASSNQPVNNAFARAQNNAVDGISQLVFQVIKGTHGRLHTRGGTTVEFLLDVATDPQYCSTSSDGTEAQLPFRILSLVFEHVCRFMDPKYFLGFWEYIATSIKGVIATFAKVADEDSTTALSIVVLEMLKVVAETLSFDGGKFVGPNMSSLANDVFKVLLSLSHESVFGKISHEQQPKFLSTMFSVAVPFLESSLLDNFLANALPGLLFVQNDSQQSVDSLVMKAQTIAQEVPPAMKSSSARSIVCQELLRAASLIAGKDKKKSMEIVFAASVLAGESLMEDSAASDQIFFPKAAEEFTVEWKVKEKLIKMCLFEIKKKEISSDILSEISLSLRCVPFLVLMGTSEESGQETSDYFKQSSSWIISALEILQDAEVGKAERILIHQRVSTALALESLSSLSLASVGCINKTSTIEKPIKRVNAIVAKLLMKNSDSVWIIKAVSAYNRILRELNFDPILHDKVDEVFDALVPNLRSPSHFLRLHSLEILISYPKKPFVTDHADLDLSEDLDEEPSFHPNTQGTTYPKSGLSGLCDIMDTLLKLEQAEIGLQNERALLSLISRVEVLGRTGKLPVLYAEAAVNHMLGTFYVKFSPLWEAATRAIVALANGHEDTVWPAIEAKLVSVISRHPDRRELKDKSNSDDKSEGLDHLDRCIQWEKTSGNFFSLLVGRDDSDASGATVGKYLITDGETVMDSVWRIAEHVPQLISRHSRVIVPVFIEFLHGQYFKYHTNDPDAKELQLRDHTTEISSYDIALFDKYVLQKRLVVFLRAFASISGPQQLVKHRLLEMIFISFLNHQEVQIVQLAFSCLLRYKPAYLVPYSEFLKTVLRKGGLREGLLNFSEKIKEEPIDSEHYKNLVPIVSRILFGRLIARGIEKKSSKDSPAARRAAILSFLSMLCRNESDLFPFFYLMSRSFLPKDQTTRPVEIMEHTEKMKLLTILSSVDKVDLSNVRGPVFEGILNLMEAVISQLGVRATSFVPQMTSITLAIMKNVEVKKAINVEESSVDEESAEVDNRNIRFGPVRTLTLRRLSDLFGSYASRVDFRPYADELWSPLQQALTMLPEMAMNSEGAPALLVLLQTLSSDPSLVELLEMKEEAISAVIQCISSASSTAVIVVCLIFINNILDENKFPETLIPLLLIRFTDRLEKSSEIPVKPKSSFIKTKVESTKRRELDILCRVSELVRASSDTGLDIESSTVDRLCNLLVSFIQPDQMSQDADKLNILGILESLVPSTSMLAKEMTFTKAAQLLAPYKAKPINSSLQVRHAVSSLLFSLSKTEPRYEKVARKVQRLSAIHGKRIDEKDFDLVIPELTALGNDTGETEWQSLCKTGKDTHKPSLLVPVINACYHFLYDEDGVISRAAYNAIVTLVRLIGRKVIGQTGEQRDTACEAWVKLAESAIIPIARSGLNGVDASARRRFIMIISESARAFHSHPSAHLYGDLFQLVRDDNPDLDFFLGITHVQLHRRSRALQRLRKVLNQATEEDSTLSFSAQSMSNILLVLAQHPIYECKTKAEESFATEAIATVGTISRLLSWSKYNHLLWTALNQFERHAEQDRFLIGMICAVIDGFHFDVTTANEEDERNHEDDAGRSSVWRALEKRIIPKLEELLTKEKVDKSGNKVKMIRPTVALAMLKLFKRFPKDFFESRLHRLLAVLCDSLRNRDSDARDIARTTMAKVVVSMDMVYLGDVIRELAITLNEGYKLHVRSAVLHTILLELLETYKHSGANRPNDEGPIPFDQCVAGMMDLIQEDLFGEAQERKESRDTQVRYVKEAGGSKSVHAIEMICRLIVFKPSDSNCPGKISTIHCIVSPLLERLRLPDADASVIRKIREILTRIVVGLANNPSVKFEELLPFVYATVQPFVGDDAIATVVNEVEDDNDDDAEDEEKALYISGSNNAAKKSQEKKNAQGKVIEWRPSTLKASQNMKDARLEKAKDKKVRRTVQDGANAPKLTGSSRHTTISASTSKSLNDPSTISAVIFGLNLLNACLKKIPLSKLDDFQSRMDPFLPLLTACACYCKDNDVALTSLRCLMSFLRFPLPSLPKCSKALGSQTLKLLTSSGGSSNKNHDMTQACFKTLTYLIGNDAKDIKGSTEIVESDIVDGLAEKALSKGLVMPLDSNQMEVLISFLQISIAESEQHNPALALIKAILSRRYISPEFYDLMETMLKLTVRSQKQSLRQQCSGIFLRYLLDYPIGEDRLDKHLKQMISNINYEYQEGRASALNLTAMVMEKLPETILEKYAQTFFLPLVLQLANDDSSNCRAEVSRCLTVLLSRCPTEVLISLYNFSVKWSKESGPIRVTSLQLFGIFADSRPDFLERGDRLSELLDRLLNILEMTPNADWEALYFALICSEKLSNSFSQIFWSNERALPSVVENMVNPHPWIKLCTGRLVNNYLQSIDLDELQNTHKSDCMLAKRPGLLFQIIRNLCFQLNVDEEEQNQDLTLLAIKSLTWALPVMNSHPSLCFSKEAGNDEKSRDPLLWLVTRLSNIAKPKGAKRREAVFKCFAAFVSKHTEIMKQYLELLLEPLHRSDVEATNEIENPSVLHKQHLISEEATSQASIARDLLQLLEETYGDSQEFLRAYASVKTKAREKKEERKMKEKVEAVRDPETYAKLKSEKHQRDRKRKKRRVEEKRKMRGATAKRRHVD